MDSDFTKLQKAKKQIAKSAEIAKETANKSGKDIGLIHTILDTFFDVVEGKLLTHDQVELRESFGSLVTRDAGGQSQKHPGKESAPKHRVVSFKAASALKKRMRR